MPPYDFTSEDLIRYLPLDQVAAFIIAREDVRAFVHSEPGHHNDPTSVTVNGEKDQK
jgi:hypothetical protein